MCSSDLVLDTWFSSWLWPISVFDGIRFPDNREIGYYYPTNDLVTGPDIIFVWVAPVSYTHLSAPTASTSSFSG